MGVGVRLFPLCAILIAAQAVTQSSPNNLNRGVSRNKKSFHLLLAGDNTLGRMRHCNCPPGPPGPPGIPGKPGKKGLNGENGQKGRRGDAGENGHAGKPGRRGRKGKPGERGSNGRSGNPGEDGPRGPRGHTGRSGLRGQQGNMGRRGPEGPRGRRGINGRPGNRGRFRNRRPPWSRRPQRRPQEGRPISASVPVSVSNGGVTIGDLTSGIVRGDFNDNNVISRF